MSETIVIDLDWGMRLEKMQELWNGGVRAVYTCADANIHDVESPYMRHNLGQAFNQGMRAGFFTRLGLAGAVPASQVYFAWEITKNLGANMPIALWIDKGGNGSVLLRLAEQWVWAWYQMAKYYPLVYSNEAIFNSMKIQNDSILLKCPLWIASWGAKKPLTFKWPGYALWQTGSAENAYISFQESKTKPGRSGWSLFPGNMRELEKFALYGDVPGVDMAVPVTEPAVTPGSDVQTITDLTPVVDQLKRIADALENLDKE